MERNYYIEAKEYLDFDKTQKLLNSVLHNVISLEKTEPGESIDAILTLGTGLGKYKIGIEIKDLTKKILIKKHKVELALGTKYKYDLDGVLYFAFLGLHDLYIYNMKDILDGKCGECVYMLQFKDNFNMDSREYYETFKLDPEKAKIHYQFN
jgi:hypothetical protein